MAINSDADCNGGSAIPCVGKVAQSATSQFGAAEQLVTSGGQGVRPNAQAAQSVIHGPDPDGQLMTTAPSQATLSGSNDHRIPYWHRVITGKGVNPS